jgi:phosphoribosylanthranilate isomerase
VAPDIKICGLTRPDDAAAARALGAAYLGVIFAPSPRRLDAAAACTVLDAGGPGVARVGVFGASEVAEIVAIAQSCRLDVVQLHGDPEVSIVDALRSRFEGEVWAVARVTGSVLPDGWEALAERADALVLDARPAGGSGQLGGTGASFEWSEVAARLRPIRTGGRTRLVAAGGLRAENVAQAIAALAPEVVDVSSGVESAPGRKDHDRMRAFFAAVKAGGLAAGAGRGGV